MESPNTPDVYLPYLLLRLFYGASNAPDDYLPYLLLR